MFLCRYPEDVPAKTLFFYRYIQVLVSTQNKGITYGYDMIV
jgi:hypothetical protein